MTFNETNGNSFWCRWEAREILFDTARSYNCNKIALGYNLDDIIETTLLNFFFLGELKTMNPKIDLLERNVSIIRPLCYARNEDIVNFVSKLSLPDMHYGCLYKDDWRRPIIKKIIKNLEKECPYTRKNIFRALGRIKKEYLL